MSVDAAKFCLCRNPTNCLLSMNKSARRCMFYNESVKMTHQLDSPGGSKTQVTGHCFINTGTT